MYHWLLSENRKNTKLYSQQIPIMWMVVSTENIQIGSRGLLDITSLNQLAEFTSERKMSSSFVTLLHKLSRIVIGCPFAIWHRRDKTKWIENPHFLLRLRILQACVKFFLNFCYCLVACILVAVPQRSLCSQGAMDAPLFI